MSRTKLPDQNPIASALLASKTVSRPVTLTLPPAHPKQYELITAIDTIPGVRFVVGACGTKFGKTMGCSIAIIKRAWTHPNTINWWVAPTFNHCKLAFRLIQKLLPKGTFMPYSAEMRIVLLTPDGDERSVIEFKSADNDSSLRGAAVNYFICDEAARMTQDACDSLLTTVTQTFAPGIFISTPYGRNWFYDFYERGEKFLADGTPKFSESDPDPFPEYLSIRMATWSNPTVPLESIRQMKKQWPDDTFRQEVAAQFLLDSAGVFRGVKDCVRGVLQEPIKGHRYVLGVDLGRLKDFTVLTVMDCENRHVVYQDRFTKIDWDVQYSRIIETAKRYRARIWMDSTGIGDPVVQTVQNGGVAVERYSISSNTAKHQLIDKLRLNIERARISFPAELTAMRRELAAYEYKISSTGTLKFSAPSGGHDDTVISLALANWGADQDPFLYRYSSQRGV